VDDEREAAALSSRFEDFLGPLRGLPGILFLCGCISFVEAVAVVVVLIVARHKTDLPD
jgi:hypothetical protein